MKNTILLIAFALLSVVGYSQDIDVRFCHVAGDDYTSDWEVDVNAGYEARLVVWQGTDAADFEIEIFPSPLAPLAPHQVSFNAVTFKAKKGSGAVIYRDVKSTNVGGAGSVIYKSGKKGSGAVIYRDVTLPDSGCESHKL